jgi:hypothetical protein
MNAHFIDIDLVIEDNAKAWVISKDSPNIPILKISKYEFNLFKSGIYKRHDNKITFNGIVFYLDDKTMEKLKRKCKQRDCDISNMGISMQEFLNKEIIDEMDVDINMDVFKPLINSTDHIYIICPKKTKENYQTHIEKLEDSMREIGLKVENYYFLSETFYNRNRDETAFYKIKLILQHLIGLKIKDEEFINEEILKYEHISLHDDSFKTIELANDINKVLEKFLEKTEKGVKLKVKSLMKDVENVLITNKWTHNNAKPVVKKIIPLIYSNVIKKFENYKYK